MNFWSNCVFAEILENKFNSVKLTMHYVQTMKRSGSGELSAFGIVVKTELLSNKVPSYHHVRRHLTT